MTTELALEHLDGGICRLVLQRAPVNALSPDFLREFGETLDRLAGDDKVKAIVLTSPFKVFSAGLDLKAAQEFELADQQAIVNGLNITFTKLYGFPKPVITAIEGAALAGGMFFVLTSDYRISDDRGIFGLAEVRVGANFPVGPLEIARDALSSADQRRLMLSGRPIDAKTALERSIIDEIVKTGSAYERALEVASQYAKLPPKTYAKVKLQIRGEALDRIENILKVADTSVGWFTDETKPAMAAMIASRHKK